MSLSAPVICEGFKPGWQWKRDGKEIAGATAAELIVDKASLGDSGLYELTVTNPEGAWPKDKIASLTVDAVPTSAVEFCKGGKDGKSTHPESIVVPVAKVVVSAAK